MRSNLASAIGEALAHADPEVRFSFHSREAGEESLDAAAMLRRIAGFAAALRSSGVPRRSVLPIVAGSSATLWAAFVGAIAADLVPCVLSAPTFKTHVPTWVRNLATLMTRYQSRFVVVGEGYRSKIEPVAGAAGVALDLLDAAALDRPSDRFDVIAAGGPEVAFLQHSSGSTGVPRGVALGHEAVLGHLAAYRRAIGFDAATDRIVSWLPLYHDMGLVTSFLLPLAAAAHCATMPPGDWILDPIGILALATRERSTLAWWPNFTFALLADRARPAELAALDLSSLRLIVNCSEPVLRSSRERFAATFAPCGLAARALHCSYAMAENVFAVTQSRGEVPLQIAVRRDTLDLGRTVEPIDAEAADARWVMSSGTPVESVGVAIVDDDGAPLRDGIVGEVRIDGPSLFSGYHHLPEATAPVLRDGRYRTGDVGFFHGGELFVLGRKSDLIIVGGRKFYPNDIEHLVNEIPGVKDGRVVAFGVLREDKGTEDVIVLVESAEHDDRSAAQRLRREIKARVLQRLDCAVEDAVVLAPQTLVKTSSGKIARRDNRAFYLREIAKR